MNSSDNTDGDAAKGKLFQTPGRFATGVNYWASHAATAMWTDWREDVVDADFVRLAEHGLTVARVFPLWSDFQPIHRLDLGDGTLAELLELVIVDDKFQKPEEEADANCNS